MSTMEKAGAVLKAVGDLAPVAQVALLEERTGIPKPTLYRILRTLIERRLVQTDSAGAYLIGQRVFTIASHAFPGLGLDGEIRRALVGLGRKVRQVVHLSALQGDELIYVDKIEADTPFYMHSEIGGRQPIHSSSIGKSILASMEEKRARGLLEKAQLDAFTPYTLTDVDEILAALPGIRAKGYACDDEEDEMTTRAIGTCLRDASGRAVGGISIVAPAFDMTMADLERCAPELIETAGVIAALLAEKGEPSVAQ